MNPPNAYPTEVRYRATDSVIAVLCADQAHVQAVQHFAHENQFPCPADPAHRPVYHCKAKTSPTGEVLWA